MKILLIIASLLSLTVAQDYLCEDLDDGTRLPSDESCSEFLECTDGSPVRIQCPPGEYFDLNIDECADSNTVECGADTTTSVPVPPPGPQIDCTDRENYEYVQSPITCEDYYQCVNGNAYLLSCPRGYYFSQEMQSCTNPSEANCVITPPTSPSPPTTPPSIVSCEGVENFLFVRHPQSCENYFQCIDGIAYLLSCPRGLYFDEARQTCDYPSNVVCIIDSPSTEPTPPTVPQVPASCEGVENFRFIRHPQSCEDYFQCFEGDAFLLSCPRGLYFDETIQGCDYPIYVNCVIGTPTTTPIPRPEDVSCEGVENNRFIEHPVSCDRYFQCIDEEAILVFCPVGRYFDEANQACLMSEDVECGDRTTRPTTTTFPPIQDPQCIGVPEGRFVTNVNSCTSYYQCLEGRAWPRFCDENLWFDEELQACGPPELVNCGATTPGPVDEVCEGEDNESYVGSPTHCEIFYFCTNGQASQIQCQDGLWFDRERRQCYPSDEVECSLETLPTTTIITTTTDPSPIGQCRIARNGTYVRNSMSCGEFFVCIDEEPHGRVCPEGLWFNYLQQRCTAYHETWCDLDPILCLGVPDFTLLRSPASCSDFFSCLDEIPTTSRCYNNMFFNEESQWCEPQENVHCDLIVPEEPPRGPCDGAPDFRVRASWESCTLYHVCYANEIIENIECPTGQIFDQDTETCGGEFECWL